VAILAYAQQGFDFRATASFVGDPAGDTVVLPTTAYPTTANGLTFGWTNTYVVQARDRSTSVDPRLAGINFVSNGAPATFYVDLPAPGSYNLALALGDDGWEECWIGCQIQFFDGTKLVASLVRGDIGAGNFYDVQGLTWPAAAWPGSNTPLQVTLAGTRLTMVVGTNEVSGDFTPIAHLCITPLAKPNFTLNSTFAVKQGNQISFPVSLSTANGFNAAIALSAVNIPNGVTVSFNPTSIAAPGSGTSTMSGNDRLRSRDRGARVLSCDCAGRRWWAGTDRAGRADCHPLTRGAEGMSGCKSVWDVGRCESAQ
jgi:hypothetical protein